MSSFSQVDTSTLGWVKAEIDETLKQARLALETFADDTSDDSRLRYCITHLHQVVGTLLMVELDGAAMLAKETEALADAVYNGSVEPTEAVFEALTRGILSIPDHLARLQFGQSDSPLRLAPLINDLRKAHGAEPINVLDLFTPDLSVRPPESNDTEKLRDPEYIEQAKRFRHPFQQALLSWLRNGSDVASLEKMSEIVDQLGRTARIATLEQLFWAAGAMLEAFTDNGLEATNERKRLVSRLDQTMKKLIDGAEKSTVRAAAEDLLKAVLFEVGQSRSTGARVAQIKQAFGLETLLPQGMDDDAEVDDLPTPEVLQSVADALGSEIADVQEIVAGYFDEEHEVDSLEPALPLFHSMSNTLEMLGIKPLKKLTDELAETTKAIIDGRISDAESASMPMARALLMVEQSTKEMHGSPLVWKQQLDDAVFVLRSLYSDEIEPPSVDGLEVSDEALSDIEFKQLAAVVGEEVRVNLNRIEEVLEEFAGNPNKIELLKEVPHNLVQIQGALQILGQDRAADFTLKTSEYVEQIAEGALAPTPSVLDGLAVSVGTIGAYVEGLQFNRASLDSLLVAAEQDMERALMGGAGEVVMPASKAGKSLDELANALKAAVDQWTSDSSNTTARQSIDDHLRDIISVAGGMHLDVITQIGEQMNTLLEIVDDDPAQISDDILTTLRQSADKLIELASNQDTAQAQSAATADTLGAAPSAAPTPSASAPAPAFTDDIDEEIMEIFIEDAQDCIENINREFPKWRERPDDLERLKELRRNYHTLKGSGRMVGASDISELAWAIENMLNKVRDKKISYSDGMFTLLEQVAAVLPGMVGHLQGGPRPTVDFDALRVVADEFAAGKQPQVGGAGAASAPTPTPVADTSTPVAAVVEEPEKDILPRLDDTLLQIFTTEARGHLTTLAEEIASCRSAGGCSVSANLIRATHTLRGSGRSVGLQFMSDACGNMERLLQELDSMQQTIHEPHLKLLQRIHDNVDQLVESLGDSNIDPAPIRDALEQLAKEIETELEIVAAQTAESRPVEPSAVTGQSVSTPPPAITQATQTFSAPPQAPAAPAAGIADNIDPELLEIFQEEAVDLLQNIEGSLAQWRNDINDRDAVSELKRALHTLKGGARMAGAMTMGGLGHATESLLEEVESGKVKADRALLDVLDETHDTLAAMLEQILAGRPMPDISELQGRVDRLISGDSSAPAMSTGTATPVFEAAVEHSAPVSPPADIAQGINEAEPAEPVVTDRRTHDRGTDDRRHDDQDRRQAPRTSGDRRGQNQIRVRTELLNEIVNYAGEVSISRSRMEQQIFGFRENLKELNQNVSRFREQLRDLEIQSESQILFRTEREATSPDTDFDPLEFDRFTKLQHLSRGLTESLHDLSTIQTSLDTHVGEAETVLQQQARLNTDLQEGLMRTRMVSFTTQAARLRHIVRQTSRELGKDVELDLSGAASGEIDRNVLERMIGPFEHMIRNSIDHGIEDAETRRKAGKPSTGKIAISTGQEGSEVVIRFADDGGGLDVNAIRRKAVDRGLMADDSPLSEEEIIQFILVSGFSTAKSVTHLSGRGVGMDVVHNEVKQLGGTMSVDTQAGAGTSFVVRLPLTLSITQALMVGLGEQLFAVPISAVSNIIEVPVDTLDQIHMGDKPLLHFGDTVYPFSHLARRLGITPRQKSESKVPVLLVKTGSREIAMQVDALVGTREVVIKALGPQLSELTGVAGATILGDGRVVLILDVPSLMISEEALHVSRAASPAAQVSDSAHSDTDNQKVAATPAAEVRPPVIMVVDDSLTVRKVTSRGMQKYGMEVMVAKDGVDALEQLRGDQLPDVMLVDIEMPRMDGYELTSRIRGDGRLKHIPIIMITSRAGEKHRTRAFELGVNDYMSKPYQEDSLVEAIRKLLPAGVTL